MRLQKVNNIAATFA